MSTFLRFAPFDHPVLSRVLVLPLILSQHPHPPYIHLVLPSNISHTPAARCSSSFVFGSTLLGIIGSFLSSFLASPSSAHLGYTRSLRSSVAARFRNARHPSYAPRLSIRPTVVAYHLLPSTLSRPHSPSLALDGRRYCLLELWVITHPCRRSASGAVCYRAAHVSDRFHPTIRSVTRTASYPFAPSHTLLCNGSSSARVEMMAACCFCHPPAQSLLAQSLTCLTFPRDMLCVDPARLRVSCPLACWVLCTSSLTHPHRSVRFCPPFWVCSLAALLVTSSSTACI